MKDHYDFSKGEQGKFYNPDAVFQMPVHLDEQVQATLSKLAQAKGTDLSALANDLLRKDIERIELGR